MGRSEYGTLSDMEGADWSEDTVEYGASPWSRPVCGQSWLPRWKLVVILLIFLFLLLLVGVVLLFFVFHDSDEDDKGEVGVCVPPIINSISPNIMCTVLGPVETQFIGIDILHKTKGSDRNMKAYTEEYGYLPLGRYAGCAPYVSDPPSEDIDTCSQISFTFPKTVNVDEVVPIDVNLTNPGCDGEYSEVVTVYQVNSST